MKRLPLILAVILTVLITGLMAIIYLPILWLLGAEHPYRSWEKFINELVFNNRSNE
jgi:hypothetical protein